jgi:hypothetical protein
MEPLDLKKLLWMNKDTKDSVVILSIKDDKVELSDWRSDSTFVITTKDFSKKYEATYQVEF